MIYWAFKMVARCCGIVSGLACVLMMLHIFAGVVARVIFGYSMPGTIAIVSNFYMVTMVFVCIVTVSVLRRQIAVDVLVDMASSRVRRLTDIISELATLIFLLLFFSGLVYMALIKTGQGEQEDAVFAYLTVWPMRWVAAGGVGLAAAASVWHFWCFVIHGWVPEVAELGDTYEVEEKNDS